MYLTIASFTNHILRNLGGDTRLEVPLAWRVATGYDAGWRRRALKLR